MAASTARIASAPISWGVSEVPEWGHQLAPERVLREMAELGYTATEIGPDGFLPDEPAEKAARLAEFGLGFGDVCQPKNQPGEATTDCPDSAMLMLPGSTVMLGALKGCCRTESATCGYLLVIGGLIDTELGCVDSSPFLEGGAAPACDP